MYLRIQSLTHLITYSGDVVYVDLPNVGKKFGAGDSFGSVESVKAASDVYAPVSGIYSHAICLFAYLLTYLLTCLLFQVKLSALTVI